MREAREKFLALAESLHTSALLISDENLLGPPLGVQFRRPDVFISDLYAGIEFIVSALAAVFDGFTTRVRSYTRRQSTLIESLYSKSVNFTYGDDIEKSLQSSRCRWIDGSFSYLRLLAQFCRRGTSEFVSGSVGSTL